MSTPQGMDPAVLMQMLQGGGGPGGPGGPSDQTDPQAQADPLEETQKVIQDLHSLITVLPDPKHTQEATKALGILAGIQRELMTPAPTGPQGAVVAQIGR